MKSISSTSSRIQEFQPTLPTRPAKLFHESFSRFNSFKLCSGGLLFYFLEIHFLPLVRGVEFDEELVRWPPELLALPIVETTPEEDDVMALVPDVPQSE